VHLAPDSVLFGSNTEPHHHFIDEATGRIYDIPWDQVEVSSNKPVPDLEVTGYQLLMRRRRRDARH
jgi:Fur family transcriptional regulator, iron response regulator